MGRLKLSYNGWENHATWCVNLWLSNVEWAYHALREEALKCREANTTEDEDETTTFDREAAIADFEDGLRAFVEDNYQIPADSLAGDLCSSALDDVDWREIAEGWIDSEED